MKVGTQIVVHDAIQSGYTYRRTEPVGKNFAPEFKPDLSPSAMLALGVFDGSYLNDCRDELPRAWFVRAKLANEGMPEPALNFFGIHASQPLVEWQRKGWIHPDDPRGWFQWYSRYYMGRRHPDDDRQIKRWKAMVRHVAQIKASCQPGDISCHRRQRQALLHWAYDSRRF